MVNILYVFGGEKASGAEKVIQRLIDNNLSAVKPHLFVSPGTYADNLVKTNQDKYAIHLLDELKKLNRSSAGKLGFYFKAISNCLTVSYKVLKYAKTNSIAVIHANTIVPTFYLFPAIVIAKIFRIDLKFVWSDHDLKYYSAFDNRLAAAAFKLYDATLTVSNAVKKKYPVSDKVITLYNGLDLNEYQSDSSRGEKFRHLHAIQNDDFVIGMAGTIEHRKGQLGLIQAFKKLSSQYPKFKLLLAGPLSADDEAYGNDFLNAVEHHNGIFYLGKINDMPGFYNACDVIVNNSNLEGSEPLGTTIYEAMAIEKIVAASNTGGSPEIIDNGQDGYLFTCDEQNSLAETLEKIFLEHEKLDIIRKNARTKVEEKFNVKTMVKAYNALIGKLVN